MTHARHTLAHDCMATTFKLTVVHADPVYARQAAAAAFEELDRIEGRLSRYVEASDISRVNHLGRGQSTVVQRDTFDCLRIALEVQRDTQGAFDVAYGSAGPAPQGSRFELDAEDHAVRVLADGVRLDLGGIGKGFALDHMAALLADWDIESGLLAASTSTLLALQAAPGEAGWPIAFGPDHDLHRAAHPPGAERLRHGRQGQPHHRPPHGAPSSGPLSRLGRRVHGRRGRRPLHGIHGDERGGDPRLLRVTRRSRAAPRIPRRGSEAHLVWRFNRTRIWRLRQRSGVRLIGRRPNGVGAISQRCWLLWHCECSNRDA